MKATSAPRAVAMLAAAGALVLVLEGAAAGQPAKHVLVYGSVVRVDAARASLVVRADGRLISVAAQTASTVISGVPSTVAAVPTSATVLVSGRDLPILSARKLRIHVEPVVEDGADETDHWSAAHRQAQSHSGTNGAHRIGQHQLPPS